MPEEPEVETQDLQDTVEEMREEREERVAEARRTAWTRWISLSTALLAVVAAIAALQSGTLVNESLAAKNDAVLKQAQASDQWAYYQAKGIKENGALQTADLLSANPAAASLSASWRKQAVRYRADQDKSRKLAKGFEQDRDALGEEAERLLERHHIFAFCVTFTQVAIALSAIAALTRSRPVWYFSLLIGIFGVCLFFNGVSSSRKPHESRPAMSRSETPTLKRNQMHENVKEKNPATPK
jgi:hypothetical protein